MSLADYGAKLIPLVANGKSQRLLLKTALLPVMKLSTILFKAGNVGLLVQPNFIFINIDTPNGVNSLHNFTDWRLNNHYDHDHSDLFDSTARNPH